MSRLAADFRLKTDKVAAWRFLSNNEPGNKDMNSIVDDLNQGRSSFAGPLAWHNGTDIYVKDYEGKWKRAEVGDYIITTRDISSSPDSAQVINQEIFNRNYEKVVLAQ